MYFYEVGYSSYEEAPTYTLISEKEYTQVEFDELVADCIVESYFIKTAEDKKRMIEENIVLEDDMKDYDYYDKVDNLLSHAIEILVAQHGFIQPEFKCIFQPFGWASIKNPDDWKNDTDAQLTLIRERFKMHERDQNIDNISK